MTSIRLIVNGSKVTVTVDGMLTSGPAEIPVTLQYDSAWNGLTKNLVCISGKWEPNGNPRTILNVDATATVAHEVMIADNHLYLGVEGRNANGTPIIHTALVDCGKIFRGTDANADPSAKPTLPIWAQLQKDINALYRSSQLSPELKSSLVAYYTHVMPSFDDRNGLAYVNAILAALGAETRGESGGNSDVEESPDDPATPAVALSSITATYSGGDVAEGTAVTELTGIVVTAHYSDGTSKAVTDYTLSGTIAEGSNTITATYEGKTATFTVVGVAESTGGTTVTVPYSEWTTEDIITKKDGSTSTVSGGARSLLPYKEGMRVHTNMNVSWASSFPPIMVFDGGTYHTVESTQDSSYSKHYYATLSGYSADAVVYVNIHKSSSNVENYAPYIYYEYES